MRTHRLSIPILLAICFTATPALGEQPKAAEWKPERTHVLIVGVLEWKDPSYTQFPKKDRRDAELADLFKSRGVPKEQVVFLEDKNATLTKIQKSFDDLLAKTKEGDFLVVYYAGHGIKQKENVFFANYDIEKDVSKTGWSVPSIFDTVEKGFKGDRVLLLADCCHSGGLGVEALKRKSKIQYAALASVHVCSVSTGNWTFTESVLKGLRGDGRLDFDKNGHVALDELAKFTDAEMAFVEQQKSDFQTAGKFDARLPLAPAKKVPDFIGDNTMVEWKTQWYRAKIIDVKDGKFKIHYIGYPSTDDEWVEKARMKEYKPEHHAKGAEVEVLWGGKWYKAVVLDAGSGLHYIKYDGWGDEWNEWVSAKRIRKP